MGDPFGRAASSPLADLSAEEFAVWAGFVQTHAALARELDADLRAAHGLPLTDFEILLWLANRPCEGMRMAALADTVLLSPSGLSRAVERLEIRGLVQRIPCTEDRRGSYAALTASGVDLVRTAGATHAASIRRRFFDRLTPAETQLLAAIWDRVLAGSQRACAWSGSAPHIARHARSRETNRDDCPQGEETMIAQADLYSPAAVTTFNERVIEEFRTHGGTVSGRFSDVPLLLLSTTGAKSGQPHTTPLTYSRDFSRLVVIAAKQDSPTNPDWYHNITANPIVTVEVGGERFQAVARVTEGAERQRLFTQMASERPNLELVEFQGKTARQLPVIVLERVLDKTTDYNAFNRNLIEEFHARGGKVGGIFEGLPLLLLTTTGAKSGQPRITPLVCGADRDRLMVAASKGGSPTNPDWYYNIVANAEVTVEVGRETFPARAIVAASSERQRLFNRLVDVIPRLDETQRGTSREIPIIVLERASR